MFLMITLVLITIAYFSMPVYLLTSAVLYVSLQILGAGKQGDYKKLGTAALIGWLISIPFCLVIVYLQRPT